MTRRFLTLARGAASGGAIILSLAAAPATAQELQGLLERMDRLERDITVVQRQVYRGSPSSSGAPASSAPVIAGGDVGGDTGSRLQQRIADLEAVLTTLTGQIEEANFQIGQFKNRVDRLATDTDYRLAEIEKRFGGGATADAGEPVTLTPPPAAGKPAAKGGRQNQEAIAAFGKGSGAEGKAAKAAAEPETAALPRGSPKEQYEYVNSLLSSANYPAAEKALLAFLDAHPDDPLAGNAQYWLGETYYVRGDYRQAAVAFAKGYQKYQKSPKAPANVLKLGMALAKLDKTQEACVAFSRLSSEFPNASGDVKQRAALERKQLGCK